jgi:hypothetical protein
MKKNTFFFFLIITIVSVNGQLVDSYVYPTKLSMPAKHYGVSYHTFRPFMPLALSGNFTSDPELVWYGVREPVTGFRITEYGDYFLNKIYPFFIELLTTKTSDAMYKWDSRSDKWVFSHYTPSSPGVSLTPSPSGSFIEFYDSPEFRKFYIASLYQNSNNSAFGLGFGYSKIKNLTTDGIRVTGDFATQLMKYSKYSIYSEGGSSFNFMDMIFRWNLDLKYFGNIQFSHFVPAMSLITVTKSLRLSLLHMGVYPTFGAYIQRSIGPARFGLSINVPAKFVVLPWHFKATELNFSCGIAL